MNAGRSEHCPYRAQVAGLALHALEPDEEMDVLEHVPGCPSCQALLAESEALLVELGGAVEQVDPPESLRSSILATAAETEQDAPAAQSTQPIAAQEPVPDVERTGPVRAVPPPARADAPPPGESTGPLRRVDEPARRGPAERRLRRTRLVAAGVALLGVVAVGGLAARTAQLTAERDAETAQARALAEIVTGLDRPGIRHATLSDHSGRVLAAIVVHDGQHTLVSSGELAPNAQAHDVYVLWGVADGAEPTPIGVFDVSAAGAQIRPVTTGAAGGDFVRYAISLEPGRTAPASPTTVVAAGSLDA